MITRDLELIKEVLPGTNYSNPIALDVKKDFSSWYEKPQFLAAFAEKESLHSHYEGEKKFYESINNHFQGIQRLNDPHGKYFVISGGSNDFKHAHLFVVEMGSHHQGTAAIGTNLLFNGTPPESDTLKQLILLDKGQFWHAGGISLCGDILTVPLENDQGSSRIMFVNLQDINQPRQYKNVILREQTKAGAASLIRLKNGHFLCAVWTEADGHRFDFYLSDEPSITSHYQQMITIDWKDIKNRGRNKPRFQSIHFVREKDAIYIIGTRSTSFFAPIFGKDNANLFEVILPDEFQLDNQTNLNELCVEQIAGRSFDGGCKYYDMGAAGGPFVNEKGRLLLYSGHHWRHEECIRFAEFTPSLSEKDESINSVDDIVIELYENSNFDKRCLKMYGYKETQIIDYKNIFVQEENFHEKVSSAQIHIPNGYSYVLYTEPGFKGRRLVLGGDKYGRVRRFPKMGGFNDKVASSRLLRNSALRLDDQQDIATL